MADWIIRSGFEPNVALTAPSTANNRWEQFITGGDVLYTWEAFRTAVQAAKFQYFVNDASNLSTYITTEIRQVVGPHGKMTNALYQEVAGNDPADPVVSRNQLWMSPGVTQGVEWYIGYWVKFQPNLRDFVDAAASDAVMFLEIFGQGDFSLAYRVKILDGDIRWYVELKSSVGAVIWFEYNPDVVVPADEWVYFETFVRDGISNGVAYMYANKNFLAAYTAGNVDMGSGVNAIQFKVYPQVGSYSEGPGYTYIDDVQVATSWPGNIEGKKTVASIRGEFQLTVGNSGGVYGFNAGSYGTLVPNTIAGGQVVNQIICGTAANVCVCTFGATGNERLGNRDTIMLNIDFKTGGSLAIAMDWEVGGTRYVVTNRVFTEAMVRHDGETVNCWIDDAIVMPTPELLNAVT